MGEREDSVELEAMHRRQITLADGRYMIFYTFGDAHPEAEETHDQGEDV